MFQILTQSLNAAEIQNMQIKDKELEREREREKTDTKQFILVPPTTQE